MAIDLVPATQAQIEAIPDFNGRGREIDQLPEMIEELSRQNSVAIISVGPWRQTIPCGSLGHKTIPACEPGQDWSDPLVMDGLTIERYPLREGRMDILMHKDATGWNTAHQIIGVGAHLRPGNALTKYGLFVTKGKPEVGDCPANATPEQRLAWARKRFEPTAEELHNAKAALWSHLNILVNEARSAAGQGQKAAEETIRADQHIRAAKMLGLDPQAERWMQNAVPEAPRETCRFCGVSVPKKVLKCPNCKEVLDTEGYAKAKGQKQ